MFWILELLSHLSLQSLLFISKGKGACHGCVCVAVCFCTSLLCWWALGCFSGTEGLHCFVLQKRRRWAKGQQQILSSSVVSIGDRISSPLQVTTVFYFHHTRLSSLPLSLPLTPVLVPTSRVEYGKCMLIDA